MTEAPELPPRRRDPLSWIGLVLSAAGIGVVAWACLTSWGGVVHGHPAYAIWLGITLVVSLLGLWRTAVPRLRRPGAWRLTGRIVLVLGAAVWVGLTVWFRPYSAVEPALAAMESDAAVTVTESATEIVFAPAEGASDTAVLFQPGALVDPRAYAAVLRPLSEAGYTVVIAKQPMGIAFFSLGALDGARAEFPEVTQWVVGGHSLGGTVASIEATADAPSGTAPAAGLLLFASYPANDISTMDAAVASISGTRDGLATPAKIEASRADLPADTTYTIIEGASHAQFGDYGPQAGDNEPTISHDDARGQIGAASLAFLDSLSR